MKDFVVYAQEWSDDTQSVFAYDPTLIRSMFIGRFVADLEATNGIRWAGVIDPTTGQFFAEPSEEQMDAAMQPGNIEPLQVSDDYDGK